MVDLQVRQQVKTSPPSPSRTVVPVKWWAGAGVFFTVFFVYLLTAWLLSEPKQTPPGPSTLPHYMRVFLNIELYGGLLVLPIVLYYFMVRPWRRDGRMPLSGKVIFGFIVMYWQDSLMDFFQPYAYWNSRLPNWGSWDGKIPGWYYPYGERVVEPPIFALPLYVWGIGGMVALVYLALKVAHRWWPRLSRLQLLSVVFLFSMALDIVIETIWLRSGTYAFIAVPTPSWLTIADGKYYQYPLCEAPLWGLFILSVAAMCFFKDDMGNSLPERGVNRLRVSARSKTWLGTFAVIGALNLSLLFVYNVPEIFLSLYLRPVPEDIYTRSYFTNSICGVGTNRACQAGELTPIPHGPSSAYFSVDGKLVIPGGKELPIQRPNGEMPRN